jgi:hypothetical protein
MAIVAILATPKKGEMKRLYRPMRDPWLVPIEAIDFWTIFLLVLGFLVYIAWRYV